jgi:hypothetical protein
MSMRCPVPQPNDGGAAAVFMARGVGRAPGKAILLALATPAAGRSVASRATVEFVPRTVLVIRVGEMRNDAYLATACGTLASNDTQGFEPQRRSGRYGDMIGESCRR